MHKNNKGPDQESRHTRQVDDVLVCSTCACAHIHHGDGTNSINENHSEHRHTPSIRVAQKLESFLVLGHIQYRSRANVDRTVDCRQTRHKHKGINEMHTTLPPGMLDRNRHGTFQSAIL